MGRKIAAWCDNGQDGCNASLVFVPFAGANGEDLSSSSLDGLDGLDGLDFIEAPCQVEHTLSLS